MTEKKKGSAAAKLKNLLTTGSVDDRAGEVRKEEILTETPAAIEPPAEMIAEPVAEVIIEPVAETIPEPVVEIITEPVAAKPQPAPAAEPILEILAQMRSEGAAYVTSKEQHKAYMEAVEKRDGELANKKLMTMMSQLCIMREDFFKLCSDMEKKLDKFTAKDILESFKAYRTDMEIMLTDSGVHIGQFDFEKLNTIHQRIVDVVPTEDESLNGLIAERLTDGYSYNGRVLLKEKVKVYKYTEKKNEEVKGEE